jgi:hypothetical protein
VVTETGDRYSVRPPSLRIENSFGRVFFIVFALITRFSDAYNHKNLLIRTFGTFDFLNSALITRFSDAYNHKNLPIRTFGTFDLSIAR